MKTVYSLTCAFFLFLLTTGKAFAQNSSLEERLPEDTSFYVLWRGSASLEAGRNVNSLLQLWIAPELSPLRDRLRERLAQASTKVAERKSADTSELLRVLENPILIGYAGHWEPRSNGSGSAKSASAGKIPPNAIFLVIDATGKPELLKKLEAFRSARAGGTDSVTNLAVESTIIHKFKESGETHFQAVAGTYYLETESLETMKELVSRFRVSQAPRTALGETAAYRKVRQEFATHPVLEIFVRLPDLSSLKLSSQGQFNADAFSRSLHLEQIQAICAAVDLTGPAAHFQFAILGDTSSGSIFDMFGASAPEFATLAAVPVGASFGAGRINFAAVNRLLGNALAASLRPQQAAQFAVVQGLILNQLGTLLGGEYAMIKANDPFDSSTALYVLSVRQPAEVLQFLHTMLAAWIAGETHEGATTYLTIASPSSTKTDAKTGGEGKSLCTVAVTPQMLMVATQEKVLREAVARLAASSGAPAFGSLAADQEFMNARALLPANLSGLGYANVRNTDWTKLAAQWEGHMPQDSSHGRQPNAGAEEWLKLFDPAVLSRYLHGWVSGQWKDSDGLHFTIYLE